MKEKERGRGDIAMHQTHNHDLIEMNKLIISKHSLPVLPGYLLPGPLAARCLPLLHILLEFISAG